MRDHEAEAEVPENGERVSIQYLVARILRAAMNMYSKIHDAWYCSMYEDLERMVCIGFRVTDIYLPLEFFEYDQMSPFLVWIKQSPLPYLIGRCMYPRPWHTRYF